MPRKSSHKNPFAFSLPKSRILFPAGAAVLALLSAGTVLAGLPCARPAPSLGAALTSGGKFAARIPGAEAPVADGYTPASRLPTLVQGEPGAAAWLTNLVSNTTSENEPGPGTEAEQRIEPIPQAIVAVADKDAVAAPESRAAMADTGATFKITSSARSALAFVAAAGHAVLSRLLPQ